MESVFHRSALMALALSASALLVGCGDDDEPQRTSMQPEQEQQTQPDTGAGQQMGGTGSAGSQQQQQQQMDQGSSALQGVDYPPPTTDVSLTGNDQIQYDKEEFSVPAGAEITLTFEHVGNLPVNTMGHNVVILQKDGQAMQFGAEVQRQGGSLDNEYLPESMRNRVVAFTDMIGGGETTEITFTAPEEPGRYPFLCTFPGHFASMNGTMFVVPEDQAGGGGTGGGSDGVGSSTGGMGSGGTSG